MSDAVRSPVLRELLADDAEPTEGESAGNSIGRILAGRRELGVLLARLGEMFAFSREELTGQLRRRSLVAARHVGMYVARTRLNQSFPEIGFAFNRDHSLVMHACDRVARALPNDPELQLIVAELGADLDGAVVALRRDEAEQIARVLDEEDPALAAAFRRGSTT